MQIVTDSDTTGSIGVVEAASEHWHVEIMCIPSNVPYSSIIGIMY